MTAPKVHTVIGLMSGTSLDGVDAALIRTDGETVAERGPFVSIPYDDGVRDMIRRCLGRREDEDGFIARTEIEVTRAHAAAVDWLLTKAGLHPPDIGLIGFHGQTIFHDPGNRFTWQIGNGPMLARLTGIDVVNDFRSADVAAGGQGAPLMPLYHAALAENLEKPLAVLNIGGVASLTYIGAGGEIVTFDTGPGNALINDWVKKHLNREYDENGMLARQGKSADALVAKILADPYFDRKPPKSLDRDQWTIDLVRDLSAVDGAATLSAITARSIVKSLDHLPQKPLRWLITGGGRHNAVLMDGLRALLDVPVDPVESVGWDGDALEAEGFGYLAVRSLKGLPLSLPSTTGVSLPLTGGTLHKTGS